MNAVLRMTIREFAQEHLARDAARASGSRRLDWLAYLPMFLVAIGLTTSHTLWAQDQVTTDEQTIGDAFQDDRNPIRVLFGSERLDLWSLKPITQHEAPSIITRDVAHPIDTWIHHALHEVGISKSPRADRRDRKSTRLNSSH